MSLAKGTPFGKKVFPIKLYEVVSALVNRLDGSPNPSRLAVGTSVTAGKIKEKGENFARILAETQNKGLTFSAHARQRLQARHINLDETEINKLAQAVERVAAKGGRSSLLLYKDLAFVAGVQNRTIITALDGKSSKEHIFTNIDSAVIVG